MKWRARRKASAEAKTAFAQSSASLAEAVGLIRQAEGLLPSALRDRLEEARRALSTIAGKFVGEVARGSVSLDRKDHREAGKKSKGDNGL